MLVAAPLSGRLGDRVGRMRVMEWALLAWGAGLLVPFLVSSKPVVAAAVPIIALGGGAVMTLPYAVLMPLMHDAEHGMLTGFYSFSRGIGTALGPLLAGARSVCDGGRRPRALPAARHQHGGGVTFDLRGIDTLGEELILFCAAIGAALLLRVQRTGDERGWRGETPTAEPLPRLAVALVGPVLVLGLYIVVHGQLTPGGGFQGGTIRASALLVLVAAAGGRVALRWVRPVTAVEVGEASGPSPMSSSRSAGSSSRPRRWRTSCRSGPRAPCSRAGRSRSSTSPWGSRSRARSR